MAEDLNTKVAQTGGNSDAQGETAAQRVAPEPEPKTDPTGATGAGEAGAAAMAGSEGAGAGKAAPGGDAAGAAEPAPAAAQTAPTKNPAGGGGAADADGDKAGADAERADRAVERLGAALGAAALAAAGVPSERFARALRLMDVQSIDPLAEDAEKRYADAAKALLEEIPELAPARSAVDTGATGEHARRRESPNDQTAADFRAGMAL